MWSKEFSTSILWKTAWPGTGGKEGLILSISLLGLEDLLGIQLEPSTGSTSQDKLYGELSLPKCLCSSNCKEPQPQWAPGGLCMLDWNANVHTFSWKQVPWWILCQSISQQYWIQFLLFSCSRESGKLHVYFAVLLYSWSSPWGGRMYFHLCTGLCLGLGGSLAFAVVPQKCAGSFPVAHHPPVSQVSVMLGMNILWKHVSDLTWTSLSKYFIAIMMWQVLAV